MGTLTKIIASLSLILICTASIHAQETTSKYYYFDSDWQITTSTDYAYFRKVDVYPNGNYKTPIVDYYRDGQVQCVIEADYFKLNSGASFLEAGGKNGNITFYNREGNVISYRKYANGQLIENYTPQHPVKNWLDSITVEDVQDGLEIALVAWQAYKIIKGK